MKRGQLVVCDKTLQTMSVKMSLIVIKGTKSPGHRREGNVGNFLKMDKLRRHVRHGLCPAGWECPCMVREDFINITLCHIWFLGMIFASKVKMPWMAVFATFGFENDSCIVSEDAVNNIFAQFILRMTCIVSEDAVNVTFLPHLLTRMFLAS